MKDATQCTHPQVTVVFRRAGTHLHPRVWMEEVCLHCHEVIDEKQLTRGFDLGGKAVAK